MIVFTMAGFALSQATAPAQDVMSMAEDEGHAEKTLRRAAKKLDVVKTQVHAEGKIAKWQWAIPTPPASDASSGDGDAAG